MLLPIAVQSLQVQSMNSESSGSVDKRIVAKLLTTYFDRGCSRDVLLLMTRMLVSAALAHAADMHTLAVVVLQGLHGLGGGSAKSRGQGGGSVKLWGCGRKASLVTQGPVLPGVALVRVLRPGDGGIRW